VVKVKIVDSLLDEIEKKFKGESHKVIDLLESLEKNSRKGKPLGIFAGMTVKELRYKNFRFYFIVEGHKLNVLSEEELIDLLIRFVRMSDKKSQQKAIGEIRSILIAVGVEGFE